MSGNTEHRTLLLVTRHVARRLVDRRMSRMWIDGSSFSDAGLDYHIRSCSLCEQFRTAVGPRDVEDVV